MKKMLLKSIFAILAGTVCTLSAAELLYQPEKPMVFKTTKDRAWLKTNGMDFTKPFTVLCRFRLEKDAPFRSFKDVMCLGKERGPGFRITIFYGAIYFRSGDGKKVSSVSSPATVRFLPDWNHLAAIYDGTTGRLLLNGKEVKKGPLQITKCGSKDICIGNYPFGTGYPFRGEISYVRIVPGVLDDEHIVQDYTDHNLK